MIFFFPDSLDFVDPDFDFSREAHSPYRVRHRTDRYAHELLEKPPYHGILVSRAIVHASRGKGRYTEAQRQRLRRTGARRFFRLERPNGTRLLSMGDCGAFAYVDEPAPPFSVDEVLNFYEDGDFDFVLSVDHIIPGFYRKEGNTRKRKRPLSDWRERQQLTLHLAESFLHKHRARNHRSIPLGVAQGWDPPSYARAVQTLQHIGYSYIALGGLASLGTQDILACVEAVAEVRAPVTRLHLLGVSRPAHLPQLARWGVFSFDSTMPLRQAFMDDKHNYHTPDGAYLAIRIPQVLANTQLKKRIQAGYLSFATARQLERRCLSMLRDYDAGKASLEETLDALRAYEHGFNGRDQTASYRRLLEDKPWRHCACALCRSVGIDIVVFRGRERNKRRGFHNLYVLMQTLDRLDDPPLPPSTFCEKIP